MAYLHPGVYIEEIPSGSKPIEGVATSVAAFIGYCRKGPMAEERLIHKWDDYVDLYGGVMSEDDVMSLAVWSFFLNGGKDAYIVRLASNAAYATLPNGKITGENTSDMDVLSITAKTPGLWGNDLHVKVTNKNDGLHFKLEVGFSKGGKFSSVEMFDNLSMDSKDINYVETIIKSNSNYVAVKVKEGLTYLEGKITSGDLSDLDWSKILTGQTLILDIDNLGAKSIVLGLEPDGEFNKDNFTQHIEELVKRLGPQNTFQGFKCNFNGNRLELISGTEEPSSSVIVRPGALASLLKLVDPKVIKKVYGTSDVVPKSMQDFPGYCVSDLLTVDWLQAKGKTLTLSINGSDPDTITLPDDAYDTANKVGSKIQKLVRALSKDVSDAYKEFACTYDLSTHKFTLTSGTKGTSSKVTVSDCSLASLLKLGIDHGGTEYPGAAGSAGTSISDNLVMDWTQIKADMTLTLNVDGLGSKTITLGPPTGGTGYSTDTEVIKEIKNQINNIGNEDSYKKFDCRFDKDRLWLTSGTTGSSSSVTVRPGRDPTIDLAKVLKLGKDQGGEENRGSISTESLINGNDGISPSPMDYAEFIPKLQKIRDISIILLPGQEMSNDGSGNPIIDTFVAHCEETKNRIVIIDPPKGYELNQANKVDVLGLSTSTYAAFYYPWVTVANPLYNPDINPNTSPTLTIAPSSFAAGVWSRVDGTRGVWKAPAGVETALRGATGLEFQVEEGEQDQLNPLGVNCFRRLPSYGPVIWGTRTLATKANPEWRYIPVRRTAIMIEQSIYNSIQWAVFEPNDHRLWSCLRVNIDSFMNGMWRAGAFQGERASDAYFVRCSLGDTMIQGDIDRGQVIVIVGFAPLKPAEFVIVRIQQKVAQQ